MSVGTGVLVAGGSVAGGSMVGFGFTVADGGGKYICVLVGMVTTVFVAGAMSVGPGVLVFGGTL